MGESVVLLEIAFANQDTLEKNAIGALAII